MLPVIHGHGVDLALAIPFERDARCQRQSKLEWNTSLSNQCFAVILPTDTAFCVAKLTLT